MPAVGGSETGGAIFAGLRFFLFGFDPGTESQYRSEIFLRGGVHVGKYDKCRCTHVVVSGRVYDDPVCVVAREDGMTLVTESWIEDCVDFGSIADARRILYRPLKDLNGIPGCDTLYICLTGYQRQERDDIMRMVEMMGANFSKPLIANKITHLICYKFEGEKYELAKRVNIKLVNHRWLEDCLKAWKILPVDNYAKSGWEMEAHANDSEEETQDEGATFSIQKDNTADATSQKDMQRHGNSDFSTKVLKTYTREKNPEATSYKSSCNAENILMSNRSLSTPSNNLSNNINLSIYGSKDSKKGDFILPKPVEVDGVRHSHSCMIDIEKEGNEELLDVRSTIMFGTTERKSSPLFSLRKTPVKPEESPRHLPGSLQRNMFEDSTLADFDIFASASKQNNTRHSIINQTASTGTHLHQIDSLAQKRKTSSPGTGTSSLELHQNSKSNAHCWSMSNKSTQFKDTVLTAANEDANDHCKVNHSTPLVGMGSGNLTSDLNVRSSKSKPQTCSKKSLLTGGSSNVGVLPISELVHNPAFIKEPVRVMDLDWTTSSIANLSVLGPKTSDCTVPPACERKTILADGVGPLKSDDLKTHMNHTASGKEALILNGREVDESSPLGKESRSCSISSKKSMLAGLSGCLEISMKDSLNLPIKVKEQQQKQYEKISPPESLKSDITRLRNGTSPEIVNGKAENIETLSKKVFLKKKLCSNKPRRNRRKHTEDETPACLDKSVNGNKESFMSRDVESEKVVSVGQNLVIESKTVVEDNLNGTPLISSSCMNDKVRVDMVVTSKDSDRQNPAVKIRGSTVKSDKYCCKREVKDNGKSKQRSNKRLNIRNETAACLDKSLTGNKESFMSVNMEHEMAVIDEQNLVIKPKIVVEDNDNITPLVSNRCKNFEVRADMGATSKDSDKQKPAVKMKGSTVKSDKYGCKREVKVSRKSKQSPNKRHHFEIETASCLDKNVIGNKESFMSKNMEHEMAVSDEQNLVIKPKIVVEDNGNITPLVSNRCKNLEVRADMGGTSKDSDKHKPAVEIRGSTVKSDKYGCKREVKVGGKSKQRPNKRHHFEIETAACLDKNVIGNKESFMSKNVEHEMTVSDEQNLVIQPKTVVEDNDNITPLVSNRCKNLEVRADMGGTSKDSGKQKPAVEIRGSTVKSDKYGCKREVKVGGKSRHIEEKVGANVGNQGTLLKPTVEPVLFIFRGHCWQRKHFKEVIKRLKGRMCQDSHKWSYQATHFIVPEPICRTEKFFAAAAAGRWILKTDYLSASNEAGKFLSEEPFEWFDSVLTEDGNIDLKAPRKWRHLKEKTGHGAFYGLRIVIYGECIAPSLDTFKRVVKAGNGTIVATSPPYTRFLNSEIDFAIVSSGIPRVDLWVQEFMRHEIPCVLADYLVEYICKPGHSLDRHVLFNTHNWAKKSFEKISIRSEEIISCDSGDKMLSDDEDEIKCVVCERHDRGEVMLICGDEEGSIGCGIATHTDCCVPPLESVPKEDWFCQECSKSKEKTTLNKVKKHKKSTRKRSSGNCHQSPCNML